MFSVTKPQQHVDAASLTSNVVTETVITTKNLDSVTNMKVCRVCLAMSVKMYHVWEHQLSVMYERVTGFAINAEDELPKMLCWECVARLSSAHNFLEKASKTHWFLVEHVTISEIESIDRAQYQLVSTLGFKYYNENYSDFNFVEESDKINEHQFKRENYDYYEDRKVEDCELNDIGLNYVEELNITTETNITDEKPPIKREYIDTNEDQSFAHEEYTGPLISIEKHEFKFQNLDTQNYVGINNVSEMSNERGQIFDEARELCEDVKHCQRNLNSDSLHHCKELRVVVEDIMLTSNKHITQDPLIELADTAESSNYCRTLSHPTIRRDVVEKNNFVQKLTLGKGTNKGKYIQSSLENKNVCDPANASIISTVSTEHIRKHPKMYSCTYCSYKTSNKKYISGHVNAKHTKTNVYNCSNCSYRAYTKHHLIRHINAKHTKTNVYNCSHCSYKAYYKSHVTAHVNAKHTKTNVYDCTYCSFKAYYKSHLTAHVNAKHTKTNVYDCTYCNYKTYNKGHLTVHVNAIHTKTNVYDCSHCSFKAFRKAELNRHVNAKHTKTI